MLSTLAHVDYEDAFLVETGQAQDRTGVVKSLNDMRLIFLADDPDPEGAS